MNKLSAPITSIFFLTLCIWGLNSELKNLGDINFLRNLESEVSKYFSPAPSWTKQENANLLDKYLDKNSHESTHSSAPKVPFELGRIKLLLSAKEIALEEKIELICESQELFSQALAKSPRNIDFNLALADIQSLSRLLPTACKKSPEQERSLSVQERLKLLSHLGPYETNSAYKSGLIYRAIGDDLGAMKRFRLFEEYTPYPKEEFRNFIISLTSTPAELKEAIPRRYPSVLLWLRSYENIKGELKGDYLKAFEVAIVETLDHIIQKIRGNKLPEKKLEEILLSFYNDPITRTSSEIRKTIAKLLFEYYVINDNPHAKKLMESLCERDKMDLSASKDFSNKSRKSGSIYNWYPNNSNKIINIDLRSEGLGIFLNNTKSPDLFVLRGSNSNLLPKTLKAQIWESEDNQDFSLTKDNLPVDTGIIGSNQSLYFFPGEIRSPYMKIFFKFSGEHFNPTINGPLNSLIEAHYVNGIK